MVIHSMEYSGNGAQCHFRNETDALIKA